LSASRPRKAGQPVHPAQKPGLRLVKNKDERPRPEPDPELKEVLDDCRRRYRVQRERIEHEPEGKDAA
jgi:hypothetical protein